MKFKDNSAFKTDKFKYTSDEYTSEEMKDLERSNFNSKLAKEIQDKKDRAFVEVMEDDERGAAYVAGKETEKLKKAHEIKQEAANYVDMAAGTSSYKVNLAEWGMWLLMQKGFPKGYEYHCVPTKPGHLNIYGKNFETKDGVIFVLKAPNGKVFIKAMGITFETWVDVTAVQLMCIEVENTVDMVEGRLEKMDSNKIVEEAVRKHGIVDAKGNPIRSN